MEQRLHPVKATIKAHIFHEIFTPKSYNYMSRILAQSPVYMVPRNFQFWPIYGFLPIYGALQLQFRWFQFYLKANT